MNNEAAERLLHRLGDDAMGEDRNLIDAALAAERRATVGRIRAAIRSGGTFVPYIGDKVVAWVESVLDEQVGP